MKIAIIGAGIAGLTAATLLKEAGHTTSVFEKSRGPGGRMSTRRSDFGRFDHGAQYFTLRDNNFKAFLKKPSLNNTFAPWDIDFYSWDKGEFQKDIHDDIRYVGTPGMNAICKALADDIDLFKGIRICELKRNRNLWTLKDEDGQIYTDFDFVISSAPPKQSFDLLKGHCDFTDQLENVEMRPCFSVIAKSAKMVLPYDATRFKDHDILGFAANNHSKPDRNDSNTIVLHSNFDWAKANIDRDQNDLLNEIMRSAEDTFSLNFDDIEYKTIHRWLYANPFKNESGYKFLLDESAGLGAFGDWCIVGRVECAYQSGQAIADSILKE